VAVLRDDAPRFELDQAEREALAVDDASRDSLPDPLGLELARFFEGAQSAIVSCAATRL
jgi:hypothetical protein